MVWDGLGAEEADLCQLDVAGAESPAPSPLDGLARFGEEGAGPGGVARSQPRVRECRKDARLVPHRGGGDVAGRELGGAEKGGGLDPGEQTTAH